jgi:hypothetical protein
MNSFPYMTNYVNEVFTREKGRVDYIFLRPLLQVFYFFLRFVIFPIKYLIHRGPYGHEARLIDGVLALGMKYLASEEAVELIVRHVQIEPLIYRHLLAVGGKAPAEKPSHPKFNGIDGDFNIENLTEMMRHNLTIGHDELSYEVVDRFDRDSFLEHIDEIRQRVPEDHELISKKAIEATRKSSLGWIGATNVVIFIVIIITIFGDLKTAVKALNSFGADSLLLWSMKRLYAHDRDVLTDLDFYLQAPNNRSHYNSSVFFSDPSLYLQYHVAFDEYAYETLRTRQPALSPEASAPSES